MSTTKPNDISEEPLLDSPNDISEEEPLWYEPSFWFEPDEILQHCFWFERQFVVDVLLALLVHVFLHAVRTDSYVTWISRCLIYKSLYFALASMLYQLHMVVENRAKLSTVFVVERVGFCLGLLYLQSGFVSCLLLAFVLSVWSNLVLFMDPSQRTRLLDETEDVEELQEMNSELKAHKQNLMSKLELATKALEYYQSHVQDDQIEPNQKATFEEVGPEESVAEAPVDLDNYHEEKSAIEENYPYLEKENEDLWTLLHNLEEKCDELEEKCDELENENEALNEQTNYFSLLKDDISKGLISLRGRYQDLVQDYHRLKEESKTSYRDLKEEFDGRYQNVLKKLSDSEGRNCVLQKVNEDMLTDFSTLKERYYKLDEVNTELLRQLDDLEKKYHRLKESEENSIDIEMYHVLEKLKQDISTGYSSLKVRYAELEKENQDVVHQMSDLEEKYKILEKVSQDRLNDFISLKETYDELEKENQDALNQLSNSESVCNILTENFYQLEKQKAKLLIKVQSLEAKHLELEKEKEYVWLEAKD